MHNPQRKWITLLVLAFCLMLLTPTTFAFVKVPTAPADTDVADLLEAGLAKIEEQDYIGAIEDFSAIVEVDPNIWDAYYFRAFAHSQTGQYELAIDDYTRVLDLRPFDADVYALRGDTFIFTGDLEEANLDYEASLYLSPRSPLGYRGKALLSLRNGREDDAVIYESVFTALQILITGNPDDALDELSTVIDDADSDETPAQLGYAYYNRSNIFIAQNEMGKALDDLDLAIELQPDMQDYYMARGYIYSTIGELDKAAPDFYERMSLVESNTVNGTLALNDTHTVQMEYGTVARLTFEGTAGQDVTIRAVDAGQVGVDALLVLLDPDGNAIAGNDDGGGNLDSLIEQFELPADGTYTAVISHANGGFSGEIDISLE